MSEFNNMDLFLEPKTKQYGSHMVMTNVHKQTKTKLVNVDMKFSDEYNYSQIANYNITLPQRIINNEFNYSPIANYNITLPERINDVKSIEIMNIEVPISYYNISMNLGNSFFKTMNLDGSNPIVITLPDGQYDGSTLKTKFDSLLTTSGLTYNFDGYRSKFTGNVKIEFDIDSTGNSDKYNFKSKLGWLLGFRNTSYVITTNIVSEAAVDLNGPRYLYLAVDDFNNKGAQNSFITPLSSSMINKKVIARVAMNNYMFPYGYIGAFTHLNGLTSDIRSYNGTVDLLKLNVQLLNENGSPMQLNGLDFSFLMKITHE
jgi:hypothetical protein